MIDLCFITDSKYTIATMTAIKSISKACPEINITANIICDNLSAYEKQCIKKIETDYCHINIIEIENPFQNIDCHHRHVSKAALLKFNLPTIFKNLDKILYLDGDILVYKDLDKLFNINLENYYAAVVDDMTANKDGHAKLLGVDKYFNSGVMLLNLKKMREDDIPIKLIDYKIATQDDISFMDQNAFNYVFCNNIKFISPNFNYMKPNYKKFSNKELSSYYNLSDDEFKEIQKNHAILHISNKNKPWITILDSCFNEYLPFLLQIPNSKLKLRTLFNIIIGTLCTLFVKYTKLILEKIFKIICPNYIRTSWIKPIKYGLSQAAHSPKIIISLTSYPERMKDIKYCLYSLLKQTLKPDKIILWLTKDEFPNGELDIPQEVLNLKKYGLTIDWCENFKSYNKLLPALKKYPDDLIVTADDDIYYNRDWLKILYKAYKKNPYVINAHRAHKILKNRNGEIVKYRNWSHEISDYTPAFSTFLTGVGGVIYPPHVFNENVFNTELLKKISPDNDDIWFWGMSVLNDTKIKVTENAKCLNYINTKREYGKTNDRTLAQINYHNGYNDIQLENLLEYYPNIKEKLYSDIKTYGIYKDDLKNILKNGEFVLKTQYLAFKLFNKIYRIYRNR